MKTWPPSIAWPKGTPRNHLPGGQELPWLAGCRPKRAVEKTQRRSRVALGNMAPKTRGRCLSDQLACLIKLLMLRRVN
jgi:hypothetical protein